MTHFTVDTVAPTGSIVINGEDQYTTSQLIVLTLTSTDATSGVYQIRFSNDGVWNTERWESPVAIKPWNLIAGDGIKTVYYQIQDNAGNMATYSDSITLSATTPSPTPTASSSPTSPTPTPTRTPSPSEEKTEQVPIPKPSVPEFTEEQTDNNTIEIIIKNQPFDWNNTYRYSFFYNVRTRINDGNWSDAYNIEDVYPLQSHSDYTVLVYSSLGNDDDAFIQISPSPDPYVSWIHAPYNAKLDVQVQAYIGYGQRGPFQLPFWPYEFKGESSGWSGTQTLTIGKSQTAMPSPSKPELVNIIIGTVFVAIVLGAALGLLVYIIKRK